MSDLYENATPSFPHLVVYTEDGEQLFSFAKAEFWTIGRGRTNTIILQDRWASRNHAAIQIISQTIGQNSSRFYLVDLGSYNGSFVNGHRVTVPVMLKNGDRLTIGRTEIIFHKPHQPIDSQFFSGTDLSEQPTVPAEQSHLTPSEEKVFRQVVQGLTNKEIGKRLQISPRTVQTHLSSIMTKLNLANRAQIVRFAFEHGYRLLDSSERV